MHHLRRYEQRLRGLPKEAFIAELNHALQAAVPAPRWPFPAHDTPSGPASSTVAAAPPVDIPLPLPPLLAAAVGNAFRG